MSRRDDGDQGLPTGSATTSTRLFRRLGRRSRGSRRVKLLLDSPAYPVVRWRLDEGLNLGHPFG